jgi:hypothetical protein
VHRQLLASTAFIALAIASSARADTTIDTKVTTPVRTSTAKPAGADNISIVAAGSVVPTTGNAVTIDSNNSVSNAGTIQITNADNANGILVNAGVTGGITNTGKIIVDETYVQVDTDKDGDLDGPFAQGTNRAGIRTLGAFTGTIAHSGEITVKGNDSAGITLGGPLTGNFTHTGKTDVLGDRSVGVRLQDVTGNVTLGGRITATGLNAVGARLDGKITGSLSVEGIIGATGYRSTTAATDPSKLDPDDLLQGGPALLIANDLTGGITLSGVADKVADISVFGAAPAVQIGASDHAVTIGATGGATPAAGLVVNGKVTANGVYSGITATAISIGGLGAPVSIAQGVSIGGAVQSTASAASATGIRFGAGATTPLLTVSGSLSAAGGGTGATQTAAVLIDAGASVPTIRNTGAIKAGSTGATATAILDKSGALTLVENNGLIASAGADSSRSVAIDLSANTSGATVRQAAPASGAAPSISGAIRFGSGNDLLEVSAGSITGDVLFGAGNNNFTMSGASTYAGTATFGAGTDTVTVGGTAQYNGVADFAGGGADQLLITGKGVFAGRLLNATNVAVNVASGGGTFGATGGAKIASLALGEGSILSVTVDKANPTANLIEVNGATTIGTGSQLAIRLAGASDITGQYVVLRSGTLTGANNLTLSTTAVPFLYKGQIVAGAANEIAVAVTRKAKTELGLNAAGVSAFDAIDTAITSDAKLATAIRGINDGATFRAAIDQMLPNYAGGVFESVTLASRTAASHLREPVGPYPDENDWRVWLTPLGWDSSKDQRSSTEYSVRGWGLSGGVERQTGMGALGLSLGYFHGRTNEGVAVNRINHNQFELAGSWRGSWGGLIASARASAAYLTFDGRRTFDGLIGTEKVQRNATSDWNGTLYSGSAAIGYEIKFGFGDFTLRPTVALDYYKLSEDAYREAGGGSGFDLIVNKRTSDELAITAGIAAGMNFGGVNRYDQFSRLEIEAGRRQHLAGSLGATTASFAGGTPFTLTPESRDSGWTAKARAITGTNEVRLSGEAGAEQRLGSIALSVRAALQLAF